MGRFNWVMALTTTLLAACTSAPEQAAVIRAAAAATPAAARTTEATEGGAVEAAAVEPDLIVEAGNQDPGSEIRCREMLKQGSNVIVTRCMTMADWEEFERRQALDAQEIVRRLQGGNYR